MTICEEAAAKSAWDRHWNTVLVMLAEPEPVPEPEPEPARPLLIRTSPVLVAAQALAPRHPALRSRKEKP